MKSDHKNFINGYNRNWNNVIQKEIIPYQKVIFQQFSQKFSSDAEKDLARGRVKLYERGNIYNQHFVIVYNINSHSSNTSKYLQKIILLRIVRLFFFLFNKK